MLFAHASFPFGAARTCFAAGNRAYHPPGGTNKLQLPHAVIEILAPRALTTPGVGPVVALTYRATVDVPARFRKSKSDRSRLFPVHKRFFLFSNLRVTDGRLGTKAGST
jgi:hypothetical protein